MQESFKTKDKLLVNDLLLYDKLCLHNLVPEDLSKQRHVTSHIILCTPVL